MMRMLPLYYGAEGVTMCLMNVYECVNSWSRMKGRMALVMLFEVKIWKIVRNTMSLRLFMGRILV